MANLSDLFPADTKRGRLAELLYQRSIAQPEPQPDIRSTPPQIMGGLLGMIDSAKRRVGKNLSELVNNPDQYLRLIAERLPETAMKQASDPGNFIPGGGLIAQTAWHGSPHKFSKFDLSKIGTGEGAQAYGHGLYLAEAPEIAKTYQGKVSAMQGQSPTIDGKPINWDDPAQSAAFEAWRHNGDREAAAAFHERTFNKSSVPSLLRSNDPLPSVDAPGHLYKTDIPDEAVARFLDWDKPLAEQQFAVESLRKAGYGRTDTPGVTGGYFAPKTQEEITNLLDAGIPGIRYLDGGSRGAGQGSSNFVIFDPEMIRIIERNGEPTGLQPWAPGEYQLRDLLPKQKTQYELAHEVAQRPAFRGLTKNFDPAEVRPVEWWASDKALAEKYGNNIIQQDISPSNPVDLGFRDYMTEVKKDDVVDRIQRALTDAYNQKRLGREQAMQLFDEADSMRGGGTYAPAHTYINTREVADLLKRAGFDSIFHKENGVDTFGLLK